jgi:hypothetical protein
VKTVFVVLFVSIVAGAFWYRSEYVVGDPASVVTVGSQGEDLEPLESVTGLASVEESQNLVATEEIVPEQDEGEIRQALLKEYWSSLLLTRGGPDWSPSQRVDDLIELQRLLGLSSEEAFDYLSSLIDLPEVDPAEKEFYATMLLARLGTLQPEEAMAYILETEHAFSVEDYENVVRLWMDREGDSVMDWFLDNQIPELKPELVAPFLSVFAEEDPYTFLLQYEPLDTGRIYTERALNLLYDEYGYGIYESLASEVMSANALISSFEYVGNRLVSEDIDKARRWLFEKRFNVDAGATATVARNVIAADVASGNSSAQAALDWGLSNQLIPPYDPVVFDTIERLTGQSVDEAIRTVGALQDKYGDSLKYLRDMLPVEISESVGGLGVNTEVDISEAPLPDDTPAN